MGLSSGLLAVSPSALDGVHGAPIRVMLAESDAVSCRLIRSVLQDEPGVTLDHVDHSVLIASIQSRPPDIVILDIHTPAMRRAESWESVGVSAPPATIVTAYDASTVSLFSSRATGLLVKPFDVEDFQSVLELAKSQIACARIQEQTHVGADELQHLAPTPQFLQRLAIEAGDKIVLVQTADIEWMHSSGNYLRIHVGNVSHELRRSMKSIQALLDPNRFVRVHRNAIVNLDHVEEFHLPPVGNMFVKLRSGFCLPLRRSTRTTLRRMLSNIS